MPSNGPQYTTPLVHPHLPRWGSQRDGFDGVVEIRGLLRSRVEHRKVTVSRFAANKVSEGNASVQCR